MAIQLYIFLICCLTFYGQFHFANAKALIGENVEKVQAGEFLFVASLLQTRPLPSGTMHHFCAGTLISSQDVITAAQCLDGKKAINLRVILGSVDLNFDGHYYVNYWVTYKNWAIKKNIVVDTDKHEIAIIRLSREVNSQIKPAVISFLSHSEYVGKVAELAGWGISNDNEMPTTMETVKVEVLSNAECETRSERLGAPKCRFPARYLFTAANPYAQLSSMFSTWLNTCMFLGFSCLLYNQLYFTDVMALVGDNVRAVNESEYPFIASILMNRMNKSLSPFCTGILITNKDVLTSETCTEYKDPEDIVILIGANNLENRIKYYVEWWKSYNQWTILTGEETEIQKYDITLLRLTKKVPNDIVPVALSSVSHKKSWHLEVTAVAWATLSGGVIPHEMEAMDLRILIDSNCELRLSELDRLNTVIQNRIICSVAQPYAFLTYGDAGSPLLYNGELMGVGYQPFFQYAKEFNPGVTNLHFEINYYRHYIEDVISNY